jgi:RimJ/RimL family protein N-acetyltransferase
VRLRPLMMTDLPFCLAFANDEDLRPQLRFWRPMPEDDERRWLAGVIGTDETAWAIVPREGDGAPAGLVSLSEGDVVAGHAELGIGIRGARHRGRGLGEDTIRLVLAHAFGPLGLQRVHLRVYDGNPAQRLYERLGFRHEGTLRRHAFKQGRFLDVRLYGLLREEWST